jgi:hypothetical protein
VSELADSRQFLAGTLRRYLVGPYQGELDELIEAGYTSPRGVAVVRQTVNEFYHTGILSPAGMSIEEEESEQERDDGDIDSGAGDGILALANASQQSAIGLTVRISEDTSAVTISASWGEYSLVAKKGDGAWGEYLIGSALPDLKLSWQRRQVLESVALNIEDMPKDGKKAIVADHEGILFYACVRESKDGRSLTVALVNARIPGNDSKVDRRIYQCSVQLVSMGDTAAFVPSHSRPSEEDTEAWNYELLFRDDSEYSVGHGCGVMWSDPDNERASKVRTEWLPEAEVFKASATIDQFTGSNIFNLGFLSSIDDRVDICRELGRLPDAYNDWIDEQRLLLTELYADDSAANSSLLAAGLENLRTGCIQAERISRGIETLRHNDELWTAFCLANQAMKLSMVRSRPDSQAEPAWFPFQLAFILLALESSVDHTNPDRQILDLIWFPTGGGKTEAYLGLSCVVMFYRRLSNSDKKVAGGTAILTRYTLRLLTVQQFERTARVICACEYLRRQNHYDLGEEPFRIGLYAGKAATPNKLQDARELIKSKGEDSNQTTLPTKVCPWCSSPLSYSDQSIENDCLVTRCPSNGCDFSDGIPFTCIDEEIYSYPPTFVVGTIDKFAQITWEAASGSLLGGGANEVLPPGLIIQDELHLISDSLGSITGLYETAIDKICESRGAAPKVIGSTATIKRAEDQIRKLFCRATMQFPPSGITHKDSFFYKEDQSVPGRLYVGVHAQGRSPKHTLPRVMALLKQFCASIDDESIRDQYHSLVCYFNSLRELGGALVLAEDDVPRYLKSLEKGGYLPAGTVEESVHPVKELTSNLSASEIAEILEELKVKLTDDSMDSDPIGLVLSTNMISVGVDVDRLGAMIVNGQPKTTSEYIQASSRVGRPRGAAGLVVTVYNWTRPRDRSHYERFVGYHRAFYKHVEALTVTPFSARARDRALHSVLFAICRHTIPELEAQRSAGRILLSEVSDQVETVINEICSRIGNIDESEVDDAREELNEILDFWIEEAEYRNPDELCWSSWGLKRDVTRRTMLVSDDRDPGLWVTPLSMRDVDAQSPVKLVHKLDLGGAREQ